MPRFEDKDILHALAYYNSRVGEFPTSKNANKWSPTTKSRLERLGLSLPSVNTINRRFGSYTQAQMQALSYGKRLWPLSTVPHPTQPGLDVQLEPQPSEPRVVEAELMPPEEGIMSDTSIQAPYRLGSWDPPKIVPTHETVEFLHQVGALPESDATSNVLDRSDEVQQLAQQVMQDNERLEGELRELRDRYNELWQDREQKREDLLITQQSEASIEAENQQLRNDCTVKDAEISLLKSTLAQREDEIKQLRGELEHTKLELEFTGREKQPVTQVVLPPAVSQRESLLDRAVRMLCSNVDLLEQPPYDADPNIRLVTGLIKATKEI